MSCLNFVRSVEAAQAAPTPGPPQHRRQSPPPATPPPLTRRELLATTSAAVLATSFYTAAPAAALPLAPLGGVERVGGAKRTGLSAQQVADILAQNLAEGQYFITGDLTPEVRDPPPGAGSWKEPPPPLRPRRRGPLPQRHAAQQQQLTGQLSEERQAQSVDFLFLLPARAAGVCRRLPLPRPN
jgi:hypothetical protein